MMHHSTSQDEDNNQRFVADNTVGTQAFGNRTCSEADIQGSPDQPEQSQPQSA